VVSLYNRDAADVRALLTSVADIFKSDPDGDKSGPLLEWRNSIARAHSAVITADHPSQQGNLAAARLTSIAEAIKEQLLTA
jgi:hypothetical protein